MRPQRQRETAHGAANDQNINRSNWHGLDPKKLSYRELNHAFVRQRVYL
jgi:hypothetical protein